MVEVISIKYCENFSIQRKKGIFYLVLYQASKQKIQNILKKNEVIHIGANSPDVKGVLAH